VLSWALTRLGLDDLAITSIDIAVYRAGVNLVGRSSRAVLSLYVQRYRQYVPESRNAQMRTVYCGGRPIVPMSSGSLIYAKSVSKVSIAIVRTSYK